MKKWSKPEFIKSSAEDIIAISATSPFEKYADEKGETIVFPPQWSELAGEDPNW